MKLIIYYGAIITILLVVTGLLLSNMESKNSACQQEGGVLVKTYKEGWICVKDKNIK